MEKRDNTYPPFDLTAWEELPDILCSSEDAAQDAANDDARFLEGKMCVVTRACSVRGEICFDRPLLVKVLDVVTDHWSDTFLDPYIDFMFIDIPEGEEAKELFGGHVDGAYYGWVYGRTYAVANDMEILASAHCPETPTTTWAFQETQRERAS